MKPAAAAEIRALCDLANMALHDIGYGTPLQVAGDKLLVPSDVVPHPVHIKARHLARMHLRGPGAWTLCDVHNIANRRDLWDKCRRITVAEALLGHTCGAA